MLLEGYHEFACFYEVSLWELLALIWWISHLTFISFSNFIMLQIIQHTRASVIASFV